MEVGKGFDNVAYKEKFKSLIEHGRKFRDKIIKVSGVRVCLNKKFLIGTGGQSTGVYVGLGTDGTEKAVKVSFKATHGHLAEQEKELLRKCETKELIRVVKYWFLNDTSPNVFAFLIMELCEETLENFVSHNSHDDLVNLAPDIIRQILKELADLHRTPGCMLHWDLKPSSILRNDIIGGRILPDDVTTHFSIERWTKSGGLSNRVLKAVLVMTA